MTKRIFLIVVLIIAVFLLWRFFFGAKKEVKRVKVERKNLEILVEASGKIKASHEANLSFTVLGQVEKIASVEAFFKSGEVLARLKSDDLLASLKQTFANLNQTRSSFYNTLEVKSETDLTYGWKEDGISKAKVNQARTNVEAAASAVEVAQFEVDKAQAALAKAFIRAPFAGVVGKTNIFAGETVAVATSVLTFLDPSSFYFEAEVDEVDVGFLKTSQKVKIKLDAFADREFAGEVSQIDLASHTTAAGGTAYNVRISFEPDKDLSLRSGLNGEAKIVRQIKENALTVPAGAVSQKDDKSYVAILKGQKAERIEVTLGEFVEGFYEVLSGVVEGDLIVVP